MPKNAGKITFGNGISLTLKAPVIKHMMMKKYIVKYVSTFIRSLIATPAHSAKIYDDNVGILSSCFCMFDC